MFPKIHRMITVPKLVIEVQGDHGRWSVADQFPVNPYLSAAETQLAAREYVSLTDYRDRQHRYYVA